MRPNSSKIRSKKCREEMRKDPERYAEYLLKEKKTSKFLNLLEKGKWANKECLLADKKREKN